MTNGLLVILNSLLISVASAFAGVGAKDSKIVEAKKSPIEMAKQAVNHYRSVPAVSAKVKKEVYLALLDETKESTGDFVFSKGRLRLDIKSPEAFLLVMGDQLVWVVTPGDKDLGGKTQVLKIDKAKNSKLVKSPVAALISDTEAWNNFELVSEKKASSIVTIELRPKKGKETSDLSRLEVDIDPASNVLSRIKYFDELDNSTTFNFSAVNFKAKADKKLFSYKPAADAEITNY